MQYVWWYVCGFVGYFTVVVEHSCQEKIIINGCKPRLDEKFRMFNHMPNKIELFFMEVECMRTNYTYTWKIAEGSTVKVTEDTPVPVWKPKYQSESDFLTHVVNVTLKNADKGDQQPIIATCLFSIVPKPNQISFDSRTYSIERNKRTYHYQQMKAKFCSFATDKNKVKFEFERTYPKYRKPNWQYDDPFGEGWEAGYRRDVVDENEMATIRVTMTQKDRATKTESFYVVTYYDRRDVDWYDDNEKQYVHNVYCLKNCACPRREYDTKNNIHLVASGLRSEAYKNYTHYPRRRVEHYLFIPVLSEAREKKAAFAGHESFFLQVLMPNGRSYSAILYREEIFFDNDSCMINFRKPLRALISDIEITCKQPGYNAMLYRIEQDVDTIKTPLSEMTRPAGRTRLLASYGSNSVAVYLTLVTPAKALQTVLVTKNTKPQVEPLLKEAQNYEELMVLVTTIYSNNHPEVISPERLFHLNLYDESVALINGLLLEIINYNPKNDNDTQTKENHLQVFSNECIQFLNKFDKSSALLARFTIIPRLTAASAELNYRLNVSDYCNRLVVQLIGNDSVFGKGAHAEIEGLVYDDFFLAYRLIRECAKFIASTDGQLQDTSQPQERLAKFNLHAAVDAPEADEEDYSTKEEKHRKLVEIYLNYRNMIFTMASVRIKECFFCDVDDEMGTGHLLYSIVTYKKGDVRTLPKQTRHSKSVSYTLYSHTFDYSLYGTLVNLVIPIEPSRYYVLDKMDSFLVSSVATIYGILVNDKIGKQDVLNIGRIDIMFPRMRYPIDLALFHSDKIYAPPMPLLRNSTDYLILEAGATEGKSTCIEIHNATKPLTMHASMMGKPEIGFNGTKVEVGKSFIYCFDVSTGDGRYFLGIKHEREDLLASKELSGSEEEFGPANFTYIGYYLSCARLEGGNWIVDKTFTITDDNMFLCSGKTIDSVAILGTPLMVKLHYPSYHYEYKFEFGFEPIANWVFYVPVLIAIALYCILWIFLLYRNLYPEAVYFLSDNHKDERYAYLIEVTTGKESAAGTTSNVIIKLFGTSRSSRAHVLNYPDPDLRLLQANNQDYFIMSTLYHLGDLRYIQLWTDFISIHPRWKCDKIRICDLQTKHWWTCNVNSWLTLEEKNYHCLRTHPITRKFDKPPFYTMFLPYFNASHTWNIVSPYSRFFTPAEKATIVLSHILCVCSIMMLVCITPILEPVDARELEQVSDSYVFKVTMEASFLAFLVNIPFVLLFRISELPQNGLYIFQSNLLPRIVRWITWGVLMALIVANVIYVLILSLYISHVTSLKMCGFVVISLLWIIFIWEILFIMLVNVINWLREKVDIKKYYYNRIIAEGEEQRAMLAKICNNPANMRPYLTHLYKPLGADVVTVKRFIIKRMLIIEKYYHYILFLVAYCILLHLIIVANRDFLMAVQNQHVKSMLTDEISVMPENETRVTTLTDISSLACIRNYIGEMLLETLHSKTWYGNYQVIDPHLMSDFHTKYIGRLPLRLVAVTGTAPQNKRLADLVNVTKIYPEFSISREDTTNRTNVLNEWSYITATLSGRSAFHGEVTTYPGGGFMLILRQTAGEYREQTKQGNRHWWLEYSTRAIFIEFLTYNNNINVYSVVRILIEKSATGLTIPSITVVSERLNYRGQTTTLLIRVAMYLLIGIIILYVIITARNIIATKMVWKHIRRLDIVLLLGTLSVIILFYRKNLLADELLSKISFDTPDTIIKHYHAFDVNERYTVFTGILLWVLLMGICFYLGFVTSDIAIYKLLLSCTFFGLIFTLLLFVICFSLIGALLYYHCKNFRSSGIVFQNILLFRYFRHTSTYELTGYSQVMLLIHVVIFIVLLLCIIAIYAAYFMKSYSEAKKQAKFWSFSKYSMWNYISDHISFYGQKGCRRLRAMKLTGGKSVECDRIFFRANSRRFCGAFSTKESRLEAIRHIVFGYLYKKYLKEERPLNSADLTVMLGIAESYVKRNDSVDLVFYRDHKADGRHFMTERRIALMEIVVDRMLQRRRFVNRRRRRNREESITDMRTTNRLDPLIFQLNALNDTLGSLLRY